VTRPVGAVLAVALALAVLGGCSLWGPEGGPGGAGIAAGSAPAEPPVTATPGPDGVQRVEVRMADDLRLVPGVVHAAPGVIEFTFHNAGAVPHDIRFETAGAPGSGNLNGGDRRTVRVEVTRPGRYPYPCLYHVSSGMVGTLVVG
jgi:plastocyanin